MLLWDQNTDPKIADVCSDVNFKDKPSSTIDPIIESIKGERSSNKPLSKYADGGDLIDFVMSLARYCIPWLVLFVFSLIAMYNFSIFLVPSSAVVIMVIAVAAVVANAVNIQRKNPIRLLSFFMSYSSWDVVLALLESPSLAFVIQLH